MPYEYHSDNDNNVDTCSQIIAWFFAEIELMVRLLQDVYFI